MKTSIKAAAQILLDHFAPVIAGSNGANTLPVMPIDEFAPESPGGRLFTIVRTLIDCAQHYAAEAKTNAERLDLLLETSSDGLWDWDLVTDQAHFSPRLLQILDHEDMSVSDAQAKWLQGIHADDRERVGKALDAHLTGSSRRFEAEYRIVHRSGVIRWVHGRGRTKRDANGKPLRFVSSLRDVTDRKRAEDALRQSETRFRILVENTSDVIALLNERGELTYVSPSVRHVFGYEPKDLNSKRFYTKVHPDDYQRLVEAFTRRIQSSGASPAIQFRLQHKAGSWRWVELTVDNMLNSADVHSVLINARDITDRKQAEEMLERRVEERTREISTLLATSGILSSTLELEPLLHLILDQVDKVVEYFTVNIFTVDRPNRLKLLAYRGAQTEHNLRAYESWEFTPFDTEVVRTAKPKIVSNLRDGSTDTYMAIEIGGRRLENWPGPVSSWMSVPLVVRNQVVGLMTIDHTKPDYFTPSRADLVMAFANQAAAAIANARLYEEEQKRLHESEQRRAAAEGLRDVLRALNSNMPLDEILQFILRRIGNLLGTDMCAVYRLNPDTRLLTIQAACGLPSEFVAGVMIPWGKGAVGRASVSRKPLIINDIVRMLDEDFRDDSEQLKILMPVANRLRHLLAVPLIIKRENYGAILFFYPEERQFSDEDIELAMTISDQTALAIENARLRSEAARAAAHAERQRLARELHDSVSQALYGISLGTRTARQLLETTPQKAAEPLDYVLSLAEGGLAEMRALIFELKPESLATEGLVAAFKKQAEALCARHGLVVELKCVAEPPITLSAKEALYRIALEAIQNTIKHAHASRVMLELMTEIAPDRPDMSAMSDMSDTHTPDTKADLLGRRVEQNVVLEIVDDGIGFDPDAPFPGHMGLQSMRERVGSLGGSLEIVSQPNHGTRVRAIIPLCCEMV